MDFNSKNVLWSRNGFHRMLEQEGSADINYFMTHNAALCGVPNLTY